MSSKKRKKVIGDPKSFRGEFSFVNKDATNIDSKDHNAAVSWHVMNRYERWKKQDEVRKLQASANLPKPPQQSASATEGAWPGDESGDVSYPPSPWHVENVEQSMLDASAPSSSQAWTPTLPLAEEPPDFPFTATRGSIDNPRALPQPGGSSREIEFPPLVARILSYAYGVVVPTTWPNESGKAKWTYEISCAWNDIAAIKEDSCYASALLCFSATLMAATTNDKNIASQACFFQVQAMTELRHRLSMANGNYDQLTLKAILKLFSAETALDNTAAARVHLKSLRTFIGAKGGIIMLDSWFREELLATDCYFALKYETRPLFPVSEWTPGPLSQPWRHQLAQASIVEEHSPNVDAGIEHANLRSIISDIRELFWIEQYIDTHDVPAEGQLLRWCRLRKYDCLSRLAEHQLSVKIYPHLYVMPKLQLATSSATALMAAMVFGCPEPVRTGLKLVNELRTKFMEARSEVDQDGEHDEDVEAGRFSRVLLWILYIGKLGEQTHPLADVWFQEEIENAIVRLNLVELQSQPGVLRGVLYSSTLEKEVLNGRTHRVSEPMKGVYGACGMSWRAPLERVAGIRSQITGIESTKKGKETRW